MRTLPLSTPSSISSFSLLSRNTATSNGLPTRIFPLGRRRWRFPFRGGKGEDEDKGMGMGIGKAQEWARRMKGGFFSYVFHR
ncbi:hypothetical protein J2Z66_004965 [Paenibacillus eucommiae]|uniref:Uncharacterized protein n=1 Tax=Paenibacillus eucommiae TaxID=1355755 RepID=A0ABS4J3E7_9BACL|nr:hypothetical protein [Paenibacillus eucommiae]